MASEISRVLIVNNNEDEALVLASVLERGGYRPHTTWSGLEALELLKSGKFMILMVSEYLPDLYVGEFLDRINKLPRPPLLIVTREGQSRAAILNKLKIMIEGENGETN